MKVNLIFDFAGLVIISGIIIFFIIKTRRGATYYIRNISGLDAIEEAVGRATEMGRIVHFSPGVSGVTGIQAAQTFAGLETLGYLARLAARYGAKVIVSIRQIIVFPIAEEYLKNAYKAEGKFHEYDVDSVRFMTNSQFAYAAAVMGLLQREKAAANIMIGSFLAESLMISEAGHFAGAIQIAGTANISQIPFFVATCDYVLIGEEVYAAGAIASRNPYKIGSIVGQDYAKLLVVLFIIIGALCTGLGIIK